MDWSESQSQTQPAPPKVPKKSAFVTPASVSSGGGAKLLSDSKITPTPKYHQMHTPQLKDHCARYGVKALPKRKMIAKLQEIYSYTHPLVGKRVWVAIRASTAQEANLHGYTKHFATGV